MRIIIFIYYTLWQTLEKIGFKPYFKKLMGGQIYPPTGPQQTWKKQTP